MIVPIVDDNYFKNIKTNLIHNGYSDIEIINKIGKSCSNEIVNNILQQHEQSTKINSILVVCGNGDIGGYGIVIANELVKIGYNVSIYFLFDNVDKSVFHSKIEVLDSITNFSDFDMIIDAIFDVHSKENFTSQHDKKLIDSINKFHGLVVSIDIPSGIKSLVNNKLSIVADYTIVLDKLTKYCALHPYKRLCGKVIINEIFKESVEDSIHSFYIDNKNDDFFSLSYNVHKYSRGKLLIIGGSKSMKGAVSLAASSAIKFCGALKVITVESVGMLIENRVPEAVKYYVSNNDFLEINDFESIKNHIDWADTILIGNGMGRDNKSTDLIRKIINYIDDNFSNKRVVVDGDGIYAFAKAPTILKNNRFVFTPHSGELLYLLDKTDTVNSVEFVEKFGIIIVEKSENTQIIFGQKDVIINNEGSIELSKFGSGDVLAGILAGVLSLNKDLEDSINKAVYIHGYVARLLAQELGEIVVTATDLVNNIYKYFDKKGRYFYA